MSHTCFFGLLGLFWPCDLYGLQRPKFLAFSGITKLVLSLEPIIKKLTHPSACAFTEWTPFSFHKIQIINDHKTIFIIYQLSAQTLKIESHNVIWWKIIFYESAYLCIFKELISIWSASKSIVLVYLWTFIKFNKI